MTPDLLNIWSRYNIFFIKIKILPPVLSEILPNLKLSRLSKSAHSFIVTYMYHCTNPQKGLVVRFLFSWIFVILGGLSNSKGLNLESQNMKIVLKFEIHLKSWIFFYTFEIQFKIQALTNRQPTYWIRCLWTFLSYQYILETTTVRYWENYGTNSTCLNIH